MHVKGVAFLAREAFLTRVLGEEKWSNFIRDWRERHPSFPSTVFPVSKLPAEEFLPLNDEIVKRFFGGDAHALWEFGEQSGRYALSQGQLKGLFQHGEYRKFLHFTPSIWKSYFDGGELSVQEAATTVDVRITGVPRHEYFELSVIGFAVGGLSVLGHPNPKPKRLKSIAAGDAEIHYQFSV